ncbi:MAG TPA: TetR/AcrR family transcriptional regulator [Solirubrobacteraceae bacterium]|nr:TetR/AcrR family transcriptional regulator [Solirubrobacteraceae bacterium]
MAGDGPLRGRVGEIQRARILTAMGEVVRERGAGEVTVAHVVARSGVSRRTFYELFADREDCFLAAFDLAVARAGESVLPAYRAAGRWRERVRGGLEALLVFLDYEPELGYLCVVGALGAGGRALERRTRVAQALVAVVHEGCGECRAARQPNRLVAEGVVGAVLSVIHARMVSGSGRGEGRAAKPLLGLLNPLMGMVVLPYLGAAAAERELRRPAAKPRAPVRSRGNPLRELDMRLTYRTVRVLLAIAELGGRGSNPSNRQVATAAGISDQGQISKLLARLHALGLIENSGGDHAKGEANAWALTTSGDDVARTIQIQKN